MRSAADRDCGRRAPQLPFTLPPFVAATGTYDESAKLVDNHGQTPASLKRDGIRGFGDQVQVITTTEPFNPALTLVNQSRARAMSTEHESRVSTECVVWHVTLAFE
jgi:hypothetical protein